MDNILLLLEQIYNSTLHRNWYCFYQALRFFKVLPSQLRWASAVSLWTSFKQQHYCPTFIFMRHTGISFEISIECFIFCDLLRLFLIKQALWKDWCQNGPFWYRRRIESATRVMLLRRYPTILVAILYDHWEWEKAVSQYTNRFVEFSMDFPILQVGKRLHFGNVVGLDQTTRGQGPFLLKCHQSFSVCLCLDSHF